MTDMGAPTESILGGGNESVDSNATGTENTQSLNPAWNNLLGKIPSSLHPAIIPELEQWDKNFQTKTSEVQSQYSPYQNLIDNKIDPSRIQSALDIIGLIEQDPRKFYDEMGNFYKDQWDQGQQSQEEEEFSIGGAEEYDITQHPKFKELMQNQENMAQYFAQQAQKEQLAKAEQEVDAEVKTLSEKYGQFDENFVFSLAVAQNIPLEAAVKVYVDHVNAIMTRQRPGDTAPSVFSGTGGVPAEKIDPTKLDSKGTRQLVTQILEARRNKE